MNVATARAATGEHHRTRVGLLALCERETVRLLKIWTQTIAAPVITAALYIGVFGLSLGERIGKVHGFDYLTFIVPGVVLMQVAIQSYNNNSASVYQARSDGYIEDILSAPIHAWQVSLALLWGGVLRAWLIAAFVILGAHVFVGVRVAHPFEAALLVVAVSILWGSVGVVAGVFAQTFDQHTLISNLIITPLVFVGGVFYSVEMLPDRLEWATRLDPLFYQVDAMRHAFLGVGDASYGGALALTLGLAVVCFAAQVAMFVTGHRLKD